MILKASVFVKEQGPRYSLHGTKGSFIKYGIDPQEEMLKEAISRLACFLDGYRKRHGT